jgi:hypothetical protein
MFDEKNNRKFANPTAEAKARANNAQVRDHELDSVLGGAATNNANLSTEMDEETSATPKVVIRTRTPPITSKRSDALI